MHKCHMMLMNHLINHKKSLTIPKG